MDSDQTQSGINARDVASINKSKKVVLLIEDDPLLVKMYKTKFDTEGFETVIAMDGEEGLHLASIQKIDIIILDLMIPKISGEDLLVKLRQLPEVKDVPVIVLTNLTQDAEKQKLSTLGVREYLIKADYTPTQVVEKIMKYV